MVRLVPPEDRRRAAHTPQMSRFSASSASSGLHKKTLDIIKNLTIKQKKKIQNFRLFQTVSKLKKVRNLLMPAGINRLHHFM